MNRATIALELDLDSPLGKQVFAGLASAIGGVDVTIAGPGPAKMELVKEEEAAPAAPAAPAVEEAKPKRTRSNAAANAAAPAASDTNVAEAEVETAAEAEVETDVTLGDIKAEIAKKVTKHRVAIKAKLTEYGVPNSDQLGKEKYDEFQKFLIALD